MSHIIKPLITEKTMLAASQGVYTFVVASHSSKHQLKELIEELFQVNVVKVTSNITKKAAKRTGRRRLPTAVSAQKTVRVTLKKGETISLFDLKEDN